MKLEPIVSDQQYYIKPIPDRYLSQSITFQSELQRLRNEHMTVNAKKLVDEQRA